MPFRRIETEKISAAIVRQVETLILQGVLRPGMRLPAERDLAARLDVSRPTLREALAELEQRGLITVKRGGGAHVADMLGSAFAPPLIELFATHDEALFDYLEFRRDLEGLAAERAAERATAADRAVIGSVFERMLAAHRKRDPAEEAGIDADFHMTVVEAAHNTVMTQMMRSIYELLRRGVFYNRAMLYGEKRTREELLDQHRAIRDGVLTGDPAAARAAVTAHIDFIEANLRRAERRRGREAVAELRQQQEARAREQRKFARRPATPDGGAG